MMIKYIYNCIVSISIILTLLIGCKSNRSNQLSDNAAYLLDTSIIETKTSELLFSIPSPYQTSWLLDKYGMYFNISLLPSIDNTEKSNTNFSRSLLLGAYGADLSYLVVFDKKDLLVRYSVQIEKIMTTLEIDVVVKQELLKRFELNVNNKDSLFYILTEIYKECDLYLKQNDRTDVSILIVAGGWIESFYLLTNMYNNNQIEVLFNMITYQNEILELLIKQLSPYYEKSPQYTNLIDNLVKIAYEFDVMDKCTAKTTIREDSVKHISYIKNKMSYKFSGSKPTNLSTLATNLRMQFLQ